VTWLLGVLCEEDDPQKFCCTRHLLGRGAGAHWTSELSRSGFTPKHNHHGRSGRASQEEGVRGPSLPGPRTTWKEKVWGRRYQAIVISAEEEVQVARLRYCLSHGVKENLVSKVEEWPGVHCAVPLMIGATGGNLVRPDAGVQRSAGEGAREGRVGDHRGRAAEPSPLLVAPGAGGVSQADPGDGAGDQ